MYKNQFDDISEKSDIYQLLNIGQNCKSVEYEEIKELLSNRFNKLQSDIMDGHLTIFDRNKIKEEIKKLHDQRVKKQKELQSPEVQNNNPFVKQLKKQIIKLRQEETMLSKEEEKGKKKLVMEQIKKWEQIQSEIQEKKKVEEAEQAKKQIQQEKQRKKEEKEKERQRRNQRKKEAQKKLKEIEKNRIKREQILKFSEIELGKLHPKYLEIEKKYKQIEDQQKFEEDILKKNHKLSTKMNYDAIKEHEKEYMNKVEERNQKLREAMKASTISARQTDFSPFVYRDEDKIAEERKKFKRRLDFEKKIKSIPVHINPENQKQMDIERDKGKNPLKYHFLSQKALSKEQIYQQFHDFEINADGRQLGKNYLKELPSITQKSRVVKAQSEKTLSVNDPSEKARYKDYLNDIKASRPKRVNQSNEELLRNSLDEGSKSKVIEKLAMKEKKYSMELMKRQHELDQYNGVKSSLKKVHEMDDLYSKSIKTKLTLLEIKER